MIGLITSKRLDEAVGFGADIYVHRHGLAWEGKKEFPIHFHFTVDFLLWFIELRIGRDEPKGKSDGYSESI